MRLAIDLVANGEAHGIVSAGNTGALMVMSKLGLRMCPGIDRPAIGALFPTKDPGQPVLVLDVGANMDCKANVILERACKQLTYVLDDCFENVSRT